MLPTDRVVMLIDVLILSDEDREGGEGLLFSTSCLCRKSRQARWMLWKERAERDARTLEIRSKEEVLEIHQP